MNVAARILLIQPMSEETLYLEVDVFDGRQQLIRGAEGGRAPFCTALFMGPMAASRHNAARKTFRERLIAAGKPKQVALIATARKPITILDAIQRDGT